MKKQKKLTLNAAINNWKNTDKYKKLKWNTFANDAREFHDFENYRFNYKWFINSLEKYFTKEEIKKIPIDEIDNIEEKFSSYAQYMIPWGYNDAISSFIDYVNEILEKYDATYRLELILIENKIRLIEQKGENK